MKYILMILGVFATFFAFGNAEVGACNSIFGTDCYQDIPYCPEGEDCSLEKGINMVKDNVDNLETQKPVSEFIQDIVVYVLTFVTIIAVLYLIYAGFKVLTSAGDEDTQAEAKKIIISIVFGIALMWLSFVLVEFMIDVISSGTSQGE